MQLLRKIALPISWIYGLVVWVRNLLYDRGIFSSRSFSTPSICVGNLSVGGTGKTPMIEYLVRYFQGKRKMAVLSRGYLRKTKGFVLATASASAADIGDEPMQLHTKFPGLVVAVDANRQRGIARLQRVVAPDLILLDDAFQHRKVVPSLSILLTAYGQLYTDDHYLPAGRLRDSRKSAGRADIVVVTKCPADLSTESRERIGRKLRTGPAQVLLFASLEYDDALKGGSSPVTLAALREKPFTLVTGIADPGPLCSFLESSGLRFEHLRFPDHHYFSEAEKAEIAGKPLVLTTEKDYVRLQSAAENLYYIGVKHRFFPKDEAALRECLQGQF